MQDFSFEISCIFLYVRTLTRNKSLNFNSTFLYLLRKLINNDNYEKGS